MFSFALTAPRLRLFGYTTLLLVASEATYAQFSGSAALTTDYVWRGSSQTREAPAAQVGMKYAHSSGFYASAWGSNVKFIPANGAASEFDLALGWSGKASDDWAVDAYLLRYQYPSATIDLNWNELNVSATWQDRLWVAVGHSDDAMASQTNGTWTQLGARHAVNDQWRIEGAVSHYVLDSQYADSYSHASLGAIWTFSKPFEARLTLHGTDQAAKRLFPNMAGNRAELAIQTSF